MTDQTLDRAPLFFDDLAVGQIYRTASMALDRDRLVGFAAEFDPQPQHLSEATAKATTFGRLVASGWHTASITMRLQTDAFFSRFPGGGLGAQVDTLAWRRPVLPGDTLSATVEVMALRPSQSRPGRGFATLKTVTNNQHGEAVLEMAAAVMLPRRPPTQM